MEMLVYLVIALAAAAIGFLLGRGQSPGQQKIEQLEDVILEKDKELEDYRLKVDRHFEQSADLFGRVTQEYQALYQHMAKTSQSLGTRPTFSTALESQSLSGQNQLESEKTFDGAETFSNESLYNAHQYRHSDDREADKADVESEDSKIEQAIETNDSAEVIQLDTQKESKGAPPLDYAVKKDGVINHNSLNMDNVKT